jgi:hypothetical protein
MTLGTEIVDLVGLSTVASFLRSASARPEASIVLPLGPG